MGGRWEGSDLEINRASRGVHLGASAGFASVWPPGVWLVYVCECGVMPVPSGTSHSSWGQPAEPHGVVTSFSQGGGPLPCRPCARHRLGL